MILRTRVSILFILLVGIASLTEAKGPVRLELIDVVKVWDRAPHNAFTDLIRFKDHWYLAFREAKSHGVAGDGDVRVLRSADARKWESVALLDYSPKWDMRDAKLNITADGRLMLNTAAAPLKNVRSRQSFAWFSKDGTDWSDGPHKVAEPDYWLWGVRRHPDGTIYGVGYGDLQNRPAKTRLYRSRDGINYETIVPVLTPEAHTGETDLLFRKDGSAVALVRAKKFSLVGTSRGNLTKWTFKKLAPRLGGPELIELPGGHILAATRQYDGGTRTSLCSLDPDAGKLTELLRLPSGGDTSYPGMVWYDGKLWVSYYSSHEGRSSIYLARVRVVPDKPEH